MELPRESRPDLRRWVGVLLALVFPTFVTWAYFFQAAASGQGVQQAVMATLKVVQFALPLVWTWFVLRERIEWQRLATRGVATGLAFGVAVVVAGWFVYEFGVAGTSTVIAAADEIRAKVAAFGIDSVPKYVALAAFYSLAHSLLEEYYWRWFVFGQLRRLVPLWPAILVSSLGFMAHHVLVLSHYFGWWTAPTLATLRGSCHRRRILGLALRPHWLAPGPLGQPSRDRRGNLLHRLPDRAHRPHLRDLPAVPTNR